MTGWLRREMRPGLLMVQYSVQGPLRKWTSAAALQPLSGPTLKDTSNGKSLCKTPGSTHNHTFRLEREIARCVIFTDL